MVLAALYAPVFGHGYAFDDAYLAAPARPDGTPNPRVNEWPGLWELFSTNYWAGVYPSDALYRPITSLSFSAVHLGFGNAAATGQHLVNFCLHLLACWLIYRTLRLVGASRTAAVLGSTVFGVHALHSEVVASVVGRGDLLGFVGGLGASLVLASGALRPTRYGLGAVLAFVGFASKENAVAFAAVGPLLAWFVRGTRNALGSIVRDSALVIGIPLALYLGLRSLMLAGLPPGSSPEPAWFSTATSGVLGLGFGLRQVLLPTHLACDWGPAVWIAAADATLASAAGLVALLSLSVPLACVFRARRAPRLALAGGAFFGLAFIGSGIVIPIGVPYAERLYYPATIGLALAISHWADSPAVRSPALRALGLGAFVAWCTWSAVLLVQRVPVWQDSATLFAHDYEQQPKSARIALNHASALRKLGDRSGVRAALERAVQLDPERALAWNELGVERGQAKDLRGALAAFEQGLQGRRQEGIDRSQILQNYAITLVQVEPTRAVKEFDQLASQLGSRVSLQWLLEYTTRLEAAAPNARSDWPCLRAALCRARNDLRAARVHLRACRDQQANKPPRLTLDLLYAELAAGDRARARALLQELEGSGVPASLAQEIEQVRQRLGH